MLSTALLASTLVAAASAHFILDFPQNRGFVEDIETEFCGGFNSTGNRTVFPIANGPISITSEHETAQVAVVISFDNAPTSFANFNATSNGTQIPYLVPFFTIDSQGEFCFRAPNISDFGIDGVGNGTNATIQVVYNGGDGVLYQCADVVLSTTLDPNSLNCTNGTTADSDSDSAGAAAAGTGTSSSSASPTAQTTTGAAVLTRPVTAAIGMLVAAAVGALIM